MRLKMVAVTYIPDSVGSSNQRRQLPCPHPLTVPDKPVEPEAAALQSNVRVPGDVFHTDAFTPWCSARVPFTGP